MNAQVYPSAARRRALAAMLVVSLAAAQESRGHATDEPAAKTNADESGKRLEQMKEIARAFKFVAIDGDNRVPLRLEAKPLHRFTDPTREKRDGVVWVWRSSGRPTALLVIESEPEVWSFEFVSLSTGRVAASNGTVRWEPANAGVEFREVPGARPRPRDPSSG